MTDLKSRLPSEDRVKAADVLSTAPVAYLGLAGGFAALESPVSGAAADAAPVSGAEPSHTPRPVDVAASAPGAGAEAPGAGWPYVVPINFAFEIAADGDAVERAQPNLGRLLFHTGQGVKTRTLAADPRVCLAVTDGVAYSQGAEPCADGFSFRSVLVWGRAIPLLNQEEKARALHAIVVKYDPAAADAPFDGRVFGRTLVYAVRIEALSYKERPRTSVQ